MSVSLGASDASAVPRCYPEPIYSFFADKPTCQQRVAEVAVSGNVLSCGACSCHRLPCGLRLLPSQLSGSQSLFRHLPALRRLHSMRLQSGRVRVQMLGMPNGSKSSASGKARCSKRLQRHCLGSHAREDEFLFKTRCLDESGPGYPIILQQLRGDSCSPQCSLRQGC